MQTRRRQCANFVPRTIARQGSGVKLIHPVFVDRYIDYGSQHNKIYG